MTDEEEGSTAEPTIPESGWVVDQDKHSVVVKLINIRPHTHMDKPWDGKEYLADISEAFGVGSDDGTFEDNEYIIEANQMHALWQDREDAVAYSRSLLLKKKAILEEELKLVYKSLAVMSGKPSLAKRRRR